MTLLKYLIAFMLGFIGILFIGYILQSHPNITTQSKTVYLTGSTFDMDVIVLITEDTAYAAQYVRENLDSTVTSKDFDARAVTFGSQEGKPIIVWLSDAEDEGVVAHELLHATLHIMYWAGVEINPATEEIFAYQLQYLTNQFYNKLK